MTDCPSGKLAYASRAAAAQSRGKQRNKGRRMRVYQCDLCHFFHLSTEVFARRGR